MFTYIADDVLRISRPFHTESLAISSLSFGTVALVIASSTISI